MLEVGPGETYTGRFFSTSIQGVRFVECRFDGVIFPDIISAEFIDCKFFNCSFPNGGLNFEGEDLQRHPRRESDVRREIRNVDFIRCRLESSVMRNTNIDCVRFLKSDIVCELVFEDCNFEGYLRFSKCSGVERVSVDQLSTFSATFREELVKNIRPNFILSPTWSSIKFLNVVPIPKIGFSILGVIALVAPVFNYLSISVTQRINSTRGNLGWEGIDPITFGVSLEIKISFFCLLLLSLVSVLHQRCQPPIIRDYSQAAFKLVVKRPEFEYESINRRPKFTIYFLLSSYTILTLALFLLYIRNAAHLLFM